MKPEDKLLLLQDLSARLPHGVICKTSKGNGHLCSINQHIFGIEYGININATERDYFNDKEEIKPYLRPMSSMTEEEREDFWKNVLDIDWCELDFDEEPDEVPFPFTENYCGFCLDNLYLDCLFGVIDWLNKKMFDYRGLIPKDLALSTEVFNPYKD